MKMARFEYTITRMTKTDKHSLVILGDDPDMVFAMRVHLNMVADKVTVTQPEMPEIYRELLTRKVK